MFGFFIAGLSAVGLIVLAKRHRHRSALGWALRRLDASPAQEKIIRDASHEARGAFREFRGDTRESRRELADVLRSEVWDESRIEAWLNGRKEAFDGIKPRILAAVKQVHESLDTEQREKLSRFVERGGSRHHCHSHGHSHGY
jgi:Spy/CpxP family protein refolding chaperone